MFPELLRIGGLSIKSYGFFVAVGFLIAMNYLKLQAPRKGISYEFIVNLCFYILISGIIGGRVFYVILNWEFYKNNISDIFYIWSGGLVLYGGIIFATAVGVFYILKEKAPLTNVLDIIAPALFLGLAIGRIGCLCAGCCYGRPTNMAWGVVFTHPMALAPTGIKLHPTQLYESLFAFFLFLVGDFFNNKLVKNNRVPTGQTFFGLLILYGLWRFLIEFLRWDDRGGKFLGMYPSQFISVIIVIVSAGTIYYLWGLFKYANTSHSQP